MTGQRHALDMQRVKCEENVRRLKSYVAGLTEMAERHGTDSGHFEDDLMKARGDIEYYEGQAAQLAEACRGEAARKAFQVFKDEAGEWRWRLTAGNNRIVAVSGEGYGRREDCLHGVELVRDARDAPVEGAD